MIAVITDVKGKCRMKSKNTGIAFMVIGIGVLIFIICISIGWYKNISEIKRLEEVGVPVDAIVTDSWSETTSHKSKSTGTLTHNILLCIRSV